MRQNKIHLIPVLSLFLLLNTQTSEGQFDPGISEISISLTNVQHGMPFYMLAPVHPGIEFGVSFLTKEKEKSLQTFSAGLGYYHHNIIANGLYANLNYNIQWKIAGTVGIDLHPGLGFYYSIYPGEGYRFDEDSRDYEAVTNTSANLAINLGFGLTWIRSGRFQPFIHYDANVYNVWEYASFVNSTAVLKAGLKIKLP